MKGSYTHCTCDYNQRYEKIYESYIDTFGNKDHKDSCLLIKDNFKHFESGFAIQWYKYPLRDAYMNMDITLDQFKTIIDDCIHSIGTEKKG